MNKVSEKSHELCDEKYLQHKREITVAVNDTDFNRMLKPSAVMGYFQDIASEHADMLGIGYDDLLSQGLSWVMIRMSFEIFKNPRIGDILTISTFPEKPKSSDVNRGYYISGGDGDIIAAGSSKWCVIDMNTYKIQRCTPLFEKFGEDVYMPSQPLENANCKVEKLSGAKDAKPLTFTVQVTDLDQNRHMNNARYGDAILNACGMETLKSNHISRVDINFMSQLFIGDEYEVFKEIKDGYILFEAKKSGSDTVIFRAKAQMVCMNKL